MSNVAALSSLKEFSARLRTFPRVVAIETAKRAAPALTAALRSSFAAGEDAYGVAWAPSNDGARVTLRKSGDLEKTLAFVAIGTKLRVKLSVPYAKYQVGKRPITPSQGAPLPPAYREALVSAVNAVGRAEFAR